MDFYLDCFFRAHWFGFYFFSLFSSSFPCFFILFLVPCSRISWLAVSFWAHIILYHTVLKPNKLTVSSEVCSFTDSSSDCTIVTLFCFVWFSESNSSLFSRIFPFALANSCTPEADQSATSLLTALFFPFSLPRKNSLELHEYFQLVK